MAINSLNSASKGLAGLASGIDTESVVKKLLAGTQSKIDKTVQKKAVLQLKQTMYREAASKLKTLQSSFMSFTSKTNLLSDSFYNNMKATVAAASGTTAAFTATASTKSTAGSYTVDYVKQLATAFSRKTDFDATSKVGGTFDSAAAGELLSNYAGANPEDAKLNITVGGQTVTFENAPELFEGKSQSEVAEILNAKLKDIGAEARLVNNKLTITADNAADKITIAGNEAASTPAGKTLAMRMFGDTAKLSGTGSLSATADTSKYEPSLTVNLDGSQQTIKLSLADLRKFAETGDAADLATSVQNSLKKAFGNGVTLGTVTENGKVTGFSLNAGNQSQKFTVTGDKAVMDALGLQSGISNKLNTSQTIGSLNFATPLEGTQHTFKINGVEFSFGSGTSLSSIMNSINNSSAGVKVSYNEAEDRFVIQNSKTGAGMDEIEWSQSEGNLLSALFGVGGSGNVTGAAVQKGVFGAEMSQDDLDALANGGTFSFNVNGSTMKIEIPKRTEKVTDGDGVETEVDKPYTAKEIEEKLNAAFKSKYGTTSDGKQAIEITYDETAKRFSLATNAKDINVTVMAQDGKTNTSLLGLTEGDSTRVASGSIALSDAGIGFSAGETIDISVGGAQVSIDATELNGLSFDEAAAKIQEELKNAVLANNSSADVSKLKVSFDAKTNAMRVEMGGVQDEVKISGDGAFSKLFGKDTITLNGAGNGSYVDKAGQDAIMSVDGSEIHRSSNSFEYQGINFVLNATTKEGDAPTTVNVARDSTATVDAIKDFIKTYNDTVKYLREMYTSDPVYKNYAPLTSEQKAAMSDREIELWEEKSKTGLLRNDENLSKVLQSMRTALYTKPEGSSIALYDMGITTQGSSEGYLSEMTDGDILAALEKDPEAVRKLFAGDNGIMVQLNNSINDAVRGSTTNPGYFVRVAGSNATDTTSSIYKQIKELDKQMSSFETRYWAEYDRYWKQFNSMEQTIQNMNSQSSWLSSSLG